MHKDGGMIFRMGLGKQGNKAFLHFNFPGTFARNDFANSSILLKRALRRKSYMKQKTVLSGFLRRGLGIRVPKINLSGIGFE